MKFFVICPYCRRRLEAFTRTVLEHVEREHVPKCYAAALKRTVEAVAEFAQLPLFPDLPQPARSGE